MAGNPINDIDFNRRIEKLRKLPPDHRPKIIFMWVKSGIFTYRQFEYVMKEFYEDWV